MTRRSQSSGSFPKTLERIADSLIQVERAMREQLQSTSNPVAVLGDHVLEAGGKRIRPALVLLTAELCGYTGPRRVQVGAAVSA